MKKSVLRSTIMGLLGLAAMVTMAGTPAQAAFVVGGENGWQMSFDGMINAFMVYRNVSDDEGNAGQQGFSVRTGLLPSIFAFNVKSPTMNGIDYAARIGLYPQIQNNGSRTGFGPHTSGGTTIDIREVFFTADGKFGQFLIGRALNLFEGKNILTDMTLFGVGVPANLYGGGTTLGHIGTGYSFPSFGSQFRYTTPDMNGFKAAFAICDPSQIVGVTGGTTVAAQKLNQPRFETELSYAKAFGDVKVNSWLSGLYQRAGFESNFGVVTEDDATSLGGAIGLGITYGPMDFLVSGFGGQGLGLVFVQDDPFSGATDMYGNERISMGGLAQATYTFGKFKVGGQYGINYAYRTDEEGALGINNMKSWQSATGGLFYSVNKYLQLVGEYSWDRRSWYNGEKTIGHTISLGTVFVW